MNFRVPFTLDNLNLLRLACLCLRLLCFYFSVGDWGGASSVCCITVYEQAGEQVVFVLSSFIFLKLIFNSSQFLKFVCGCLLLAKKFGTQRIH